MKAFDDDKIIDKGTEIYYKIRTQLKKKYGEGDYVAIEPDSGKYFIGKTSVDAVDRAKEKFPKKIFFLAQVGRIDGLMV